MVITVRELDSEVKDAIKDVVKDTLLTTQRCLPMEDSDGVVTGAITPAVKEKLDQITADYYRVFFERDAEVAITTDEYVGVYLNLV